MKPIHLHTIHYNKFYGVISLMKRFGLIICLIFVIGQITIIAQPGHSTRNNYTGDWETPASWDPIWNAPRTDISDMNVTINGYISCNGPLYYGDTQDTLLINDTLVIYGNLTLGNLNNLIVNNNGVLIVYGDLNAGNKTSIASNAYIIVTGNYNKEGTSGFGSFVSYETPSRVFIGGTVEPGLDTLLFPVFNCPGTNPYDSSQCSYGNMLDLMNDPIYSFFQSTCSVDTPTITPSGPLSFCTGNNVTLTSSKDTSYLWSTGDTTQSILVTTTGTYTVQLINARGCKSEPSAAAIITVNTLPVAEIIITDNSGSSSNDRIICAGATATLTATGGSNYSWSSGDSSPQISKDIEGTYTVIVTDINGCKDTASQTVDVITTTVNAGNDGEVCGLEYSLNASSNIDIGEWTASSGAGIVTFIPDENDPSAMINISAYGDYQLTWTVMNEGCQASAGVTVTFHEIPVANAGTDQELNNAFSTKMEAGLMPDQTGEWSLLNGSGTIEDVNSPLTEITGLSAGDNSFLWTVSSAYCTASDSVTIKVNDLFVPQIITPNGDGKNDFFVIDDIEKNGPTELIILDRWGNEVYSNKDYQNGWDGKNNNETELSNDTYFYVLKFGDGQVVKGFVVIKR